VRRLGLLLGLLALACSERTVYVGGPVLTMDAEDRVVEALGVEGDRIGAVGSRAEVEGWAGGRARVVDLGGRALLPGFIDAHGHFPGAGLYAVNADLNSPPIGDVENIGQLLDRLREKAADTSAGDWVMGWGYDDTLLAERRHPTRADLDRVSREHPIAILHISGHLGVLNSLALERAGIDAATPDPEGGRIRRGADGVPDGVLEETALEPVQAALLRPSLPDTWRIVREASRRYLAAGTTTAQDGYAEAGHIAALPWLARLRIVPLRLVLWPGLEAATAALDEGRRYESPDPLRARVGAVKIVADGSIQGYTGYLSEPYHVPPGDDPDYRGYPRIPRAELAAIVSRFHAAGWQVAVHGNGDAAIDDILDAFESAQRAHPREDARHVIVHAQMAREDQLDRMQELGIVPSFFSLHVYYWGDRHRDIFMGPERAARMSPARSAVRRGMRFTIHCDSPVVPMEPLRLVWAAVNRRSASGAEIGPAQRIRPMQALRAVTIDAAYQHFEEGEKGSLEPGKLADLVIVSRSPLEEPETIDEIRVLETIVGGQTVWRAGGT
jgi:predicted amidohydrolase YtcJ